MAATRRCPALRMTPSANELPDTSTLPPTRSNPRRVAFAGWPSPRVPASARRCRSGGRARMRIGSAQSCEKDDRRARRPGVCGRPQPRTKRAQTGPGVDRLLIVLSVAERTPPPPGRPSAGARPVRGRRSADAGRHAIGLLDIGARSSSASSRRPVDHRRDDLAPCRLHGFLPASPQGPRELRHARRPDTVEEAKARPRRLLVVANRRLAGAGPDARVSSQATVSSARTVMPGCPLERQRRSRPRIAVPDVLAAGPQGDRVRGPARLPDERTACPAERPAAGSADASRRHPRLSSNFRAVSTPWARS
jgi:hypothetical protein